MFNFLTKKRKSRTKPTEKLLYTIFALFLFRLGNAIPLAFIDHDALKQSLFQLTKTNSFLQMISMYSGGNLITPFSLGILPFINSSIIVDLFTTIFPTLEKLQSEEGELGRKKILFYKKVLALILSIIQSLLLLAYLRPYFYDPSLFKQGLAGLELTCGSMMVIWLSHVLDTIGVGNGTSLLILINILTTFFSKQNNFLNNTYFLSFFVELSLLLFLFTLICISQTARINIDVVSARQLAYLEDLEKTQENKKRSKATVEIAKSTNSLFNRNGLSIKLNQAGIFPIIIASNVTPLILYFLGSIFHYPKVFETFLFSSF